MSSHPVSTFVPKLKKRALVIIPEWWGIGQNENIKHCLRLPNVGTNTMSPPWLPAGSLGLPYFEAPLPIKCTGSCPI